MVIGMYNNITEFREFIANANDIQINKIIEFINIAGFYDGLYSNSCNDSELANLAIDYARSKYSSVREYFFANIDAVWED